MIVHLYKPTPEMLRGLGELYTTDEAFIKFFHKIHPGLTDYMKVSIDQYVEGLETIELEWMMAQG